jgi:aspartyl-tRNA(Asn)/glutamyl-tRNA(Gln) amidotransferase subunit C
MGMLTDADVERIARLARLELTDQEKVSLKKDLSSILGYIAKLDAADTSDVQPLYQTTGLVNSTREDQPRSEFPMDESLLERLVGQAPDHKDRLVKVRPILNKK